MNALQRAVENLLLVTGASRAILHLARPDRGLSIEAEAVQHAQHQIRYCGSDIDVLDAQTIETLAQSEDVLTEENLEPADAAASNPRADTDHIKARMLAPLIRDGRLAGVISLHHSSQSRWSADVKNAMLAARTKFLGLLDLREKMEPPARTDLRATAIQAILDRLRIALDVQRCTFRQPVEEAYAFPVTFESRVDGLRSLLGDFTIVQTGQPVIVKLLEGRRQVVQEDCRTASDDPLFHKMLAHYGGMRAQVVTPFIVGDQLKGVLSVHELRNPRIWTSAEKALAADAAALIGALFETPRLARD